MPRDRRSRRDDFDDEEDDNLDDRPRRARRPRDDDEDEDDDFDARPRRRKPEGGNTAVKALLILGGVVVVLTLICAGVGLYIYTSIARGVNDAQQKILAEGKARQDEAAKQAQTWAAEQAKQKQDEAKTDKGQATAAATEFFQKMRDGRVDEAYRMTTPAYQKRTTQQRFEQEVEGRKKVITWQLAAARDADVFGPKTGTSFRSRSTRPSGR